MRKERKHFTPEEKVSRLEAAIGRGVVNQPMQFFSGSAWSQSSSFELNSSLLRLSAIQNCREQTCGNS
jgi:hypothetical protein